jgi:hypothetical protein
LLQKIVSRINVVVAGGTAVASAIDSIVVINDVVVVDANDGIAVVSVVDFNPVGAASIVNSVFGTNNADVCVIVVGIGVVIANVATLLSMALSSASLPSATRRRRRRELSKRSLPSEKNQCKHESPSVSK